MPPGQLSGLELSGLIDQLEISSPGIATFQSSPRSVELHSGNSTSLQRANPSFDSSFEDNEQFRALAVLPSDGEFLEYDFSPHDWDTLRAAAKILDRLNDGEQDLGVFELAVATVTNSASGAIRDEWISVFLYITRCADSSISWARRVDLARIRHECEQSARQRHARIVEESRREPVKRLFANWLSSARVCNQHQKSLEKRARRRLCRRWHHVVSTNETLSRSLVEELDSRTHRTQSAKLLADWHKATLAHGASVMKLRKKAVIDGLHYAMTLCTYLDDESALTWRKRVVEQIRHAAAASVHRRHLLHRALSRWDKASHLVLEQQQEADALRRRYIFRAWRASAGAVNGYNDTALDLDKQALGRTALKTLERESRLERFLARTEDRLKRSILRYLRLEAKLRALERAEKHTAFDNWRIVAELTSKINSESLVFAQELATGARKTFALKIMRTRTRNCEEITKMSDDFDEVCHLASGLDALVTETQRNLAQLDRAGSWYNQRLRQRMWNAMRTRFEETKYDAAQSEFGECRRDSILRQRVLQAALERWRRVSREIFAQTTVCDLLLADISGQYLEAWRWAASDVHDLALQSDALLMDMLGGKIWDCLAVEAETVLSLEGLGDVLLSSLLRPKLFQKPMRLWRQVAMAYKSRAEQADSVKTASEVSERKLFVRKWRAEANFPTQEQSGEATPLSPLVMWEYNQKSNSPRISPSRPRISPSHLVPRISPSRLAPRISPSQRPVPIVSPSQRPSPRGSPSQRPVTSPDNASPLTAEVQTPATPMPPTPTRPSRSSGSSFA